MKFSESQLEKVHGHHQQACLGPSISRHSCVDEAYQDFCNSIIHAAKKSIPRGCKKNYTDHAGMRIARPSTWHFVGHRRVKVLTQLPLPCLLDLIKGKGNASQRQSMSSALRTPAGWHRMLLNKQSAWQD